MGQDQKMRKDMMAGRYRKMLGAQGIELGPTTVTNAADYHPAEDKVYCKRATLTL